VRFEKNEVWVNVAPFKSIKISRLLEKQKQLDLSRLNQDLNQIQTWSYEEYIMNYRIIIAASYHNNPNEEKANYIRLWHY